MAATSNNSQIVSNQPTLTALWSAPSPLTATVGQLVTAVLQVTDTNLLVNAANVLPSSVLPSNALQSSGPVPPAAASLVGGASAFFTYTYSFTAAGSYSFSGNASSNAGSVLANVTQSSAVLVQDPAILSVTSLALTPVAGVSLGQVFTLYVTVSNVGVAGASAAVNVVPVAPGNGGGTSAFPSLSGPQPVSATVAQGSGVTFTYTGSVNSNGSGASPWNLSFQDSATGNDGNSGKAIASGRSSPTSSA